MSIEMNGFRVEPLAAKSVELGWKLLIDGEVYTVTNTRPGAPRRPDEDPQLTIFVDKAPFKFSGEDTQTVHHVLGVDVHQFVGQDIGDKEIMKDARR